MLIKIFIALLFLPFLIIFFSPSSLRAAFKDSPFVPTSKSIIRKALKFANLKPGEKLYDLGSGDGRVLIVGEKEFGSKGVGFEYSFPVFCLSKINFWINGIKKARIENNDFHNADVKNADVIFLFLTPKAFRGLEEKLKKEVRNGARVVTFSSPLLFWHPNKTVSLEERNNKINLYLYIRE